MMSDKKVPTPEPRANTIGGIPLDETWPCDKCGRPMTKAQGGTTFTVCDECWPVSGEPERRQSAVQEHWCEGRNANRPWSRESCSVCKEVPGWRGEPEGEVPRVCSDCGKPLAPWQHDGCCAEKPPSAPSAERLKQAAKYCSERISRGWKMQAITEDDQEDFIFDALEKELRAAESALAAAGDVANRLSAEVESMTKERDQANARISELEEQLREANIPVRHFRSGGVTYAVYGTSSLVYVKVLKEQVDAARQEREKLADVVRALGGHSSWDGPGWTLHVPKRYAEALFDAAYGHDSETLREVLAALRLSPGAPPAEPKPCGWCGSINGEEPTKENR
jgi:hypothetical protein